MGRKEEFKEWLKTQKKPNREPYAENTRKHYASTIGEVSKWGNENNIFDQDLYSIDDSNELDRIYESLNLLQEYRNKNLSNDSRWSSALKLYNQFVASTNLKSDNMDNDVTNTEYAWIPFYEELADTLLTFKDNRTELFEIMKKLVSENSKMEYLHFERDDWWALRNYQIDPFSVFGTINRGLTDENRINIAKTFAKEFHLKSPIPTDFLGIPVMNMQNSFFGGNDEVWDLFCEAMLCASTGVFTERFKTAFESAIKAKGNGLATITMGLFWIRPYIYLNLDGQNIAFLSDPQNGMNTVLEIFPELSKKYVPSGEQYIAICDECKKLFATGEYKFKNFPEMSHYAWENSKEDMNSSENENLQEDFIKWMRQLIKRNGEQYSTATINAYCTALRNATAKLELETSLEKTNIFNYNNIADFNVVYKMILKAPNFSQVNLDAGNQAYNAGLKKYSDFLNKKQNTHHQFEPKKTILSEKDDTEISSNNIVSHNYWWLNASPKIWSFSEINIGDVQSYTLYNDNGNKRRVFQNFLDAKIGDIIIGYESNPVKKVVALAKIVKGQDGENIYFEKIKELSTPIDYLTLKDCPELERMEYFVNPQGSLFKLTNDEYDFIMGKIEESNPSTNKNEDMEIYTSENFLNEVFIKSEDYDTVCNLILRKKNIILQGAPGVGKTYAAKRLAYSIMGVKDINRVMLVQFHQSYSYEDFIAGYRPDGNGFKLEYGSFYKFCKTAANDPSNAYFFIIDEINRGNLSKIFGELFMLIENDKRGERLNLLYSSEKFYVPKNLHIIGMMNTADRSLAMLDYALRRRFAFFEMIPAFDSDGFKSYKTDIGNEKFNALIIQIKLLNVQIEQDESLGVGFRIGHSYFIKEKEDKIDDMWLETVVNYEIIPLLQEYWFDEPSKVKEWTDRLKGAIV